MSSTELEPYRLKILLVLQNMQIEVVREFRARATIRVQDGEIRQVLANLIGNAMDALPSG
jgi:signal transduction histidine kinase